MEREKEGGGGRVGGQSGPERVSARIHLHIGVETGILSFQTKDVTAVM